MKTLREDTLLLLAGWQFGVNGTEAPFSEKEVALEKAIAGSCNDCYQAMRRCQSQMDIMVRFVPPIPVFPCQCFRFKLCHITESDPDLKRFVLCQ